MRQFDLNNSDCAIFLSWLVKEKDKSIDFIIYVVDKPHHRAIQELYNEFQQVEL